MLDLRTDMTSKAYRAFDQVGVLTANKLHAKIDGRQMKLFAPGTVLVFEKGQAALDHIEKHGLDLILCDSRLLDMTGLDFLRTLRNEKKRRSLPVIMITLTNTREHVLDAIGLGCSGFVIRPYAPATLERYLILAKHMKDFPSKARGEVEEARALSAEGLHDEAAERLENLVKDGNESKLYYDMGCDCLVRKDFGKAVVAFQRALKYNEMYAEAYRGLAEAYKGKGDFERYKTNIEKAAELLAEQDRFEEAKQTFIEVLKHDRDAHNPYKLLGLKLRRTGDVEGAIRAYLKALEISPRDEQIHFNMSKAFAHLGDETKARDSVAAALAINAFFEEAKVLYAELFKKPFQAPLGADFRPPVTAAKRRGIDLD